MKVIIDGALCKACGYCIRFCPKQVIALGNKINDKGYQYVVAKTQENCILCGICALMCPEAAIEIKQEERQ